MAPSLSAAPVRREDPDFRAILRFLRDAELPRLSSRPFVRHEHLVLEHGQLWLGGTRPFGIRGGTPRQCYKNAWRTAKLYGYAYVEGYAIHAGLFPVGHAWCVAPDGTVIDPTWSPNRGTLYLGVPFDPLNDPSTSPLECLEKGEAAIRVVPGRPLRDVTGDDNSPV